MVEPGVKDAMRPRDGPVVPIEKKEKWVSSTRRRWMRVTCVVAMMAAGGAWADDLAIPGSGNPEQVLKRLAEAFNHRQPAHAITVPTSIGTAGALREVEGGRATLGRIGRPLKADELARGLRYVPLGRDPVVFAAGAGVGITGLTSRQVLDIYEGRMSDWRELGGKPGPIRAIGREVTDTSRQVIQRSITAFANLNFSESVKVVHLDPQMIELLDRYPGSLGFLNRSALSACTTPVSLLALDGVAATEQNLQSGRYPLWLEFGLVHRTQGPGAAGKAFIDFIRSAAGVRILTEQGVQPLASGS